jgi:thiosulfate/3-mercaptopyruvate sulfurtransferase
MRMDWVRRSGVIAVIAVVFCLAGPVHAHGQWAFQAGSAASLPSSALVQPQALIRVLRAKGSEKPLIFQVGSNLMFREAHIPGAEYAGPGSQDAGLSLLRQRVSQLKRNTAIVIYCGCCPWSHCPNIAPAYKMLQGMGFTSVKALYLADNFGTDWVNKGYPVARGQ